MTKSRTSICIVWPAWFEGSTNPESHVTAVFIGKTGGKFAKAHPQLRERLETWLAGDQWDEPGNIAVDRAEFPGMPAGLGFVGFHKDTPALMLDRDSLYHWYDGMQDTLDDGGVPIDRFWGFQPHITLSKESFHLINRLPSEVHLERPVLWWGNDRPFHSKHVEALKAQEAKAA